MKLCIVGGKLQGLEAVYLAKKAGIEAVLIDMDPEPPAQGIADEFHCINVLHNAEVIEIIRGCDGILPANENRETLVFLEAIAGKMGIPYFQDNNAFWISSDKSKSKALFDSLQIPQPKHWPECGFPVIVKPAAMSGSVGIHKVKSRIELDKAVQEVSLIDKKIIIQKYIDGLALSLELISLNGNVVPLQITELEFDEEYGCKRVIAPDAASESSRRLFIEISKKIASGLKLKGLTDTQAIVDDKGVPLIIEINARLPSQTPTTVLHSSGINMVQLLADVYANNKLPNLKAEPKKAVIFEHIKVAGNMISVKGEHIIGESKNLRLEKGFLGADEAITNLSKNDKVGVATLIIKEDSRDKAYVKLAKVIENIKSEFKLINYKDPVPQL
ncbi:MAG: 3-methylornithine--L-lysine ligase PylC [Candidatus Methanomethylicus sp.]|nr:3-methylornithine--L-lysine ligase PylC [Candidatus Methanomethylicus sp.]